MLFEDVISKLREANACQEGLDFAIACGSVDEIVKQCSDAEWLLWLARAADKMTPEKIKQFLELADISAIARARGGLPACIHATQHMSDALLKVKEVFYS